MIAANLSPAEDRPGWLAWSIGTEDNFVSTVLGPLYVRTDGDIACIRMEPMALHGNANGVYHGGTILSLIDASIFPATIALTGVRDLNTATVDLQTQFVTPGRLDLPLDSIVTLTRETGRMIFSRGTVEQDGTIVATFTALQRKLSL